MKDELSHNRAIKRLSDYEAIGTVEEFREAKTQYDNINSAATSISLSYMCDFDRAKESVVSTIKNLQIRQHPRTNADKIRNMTDEELATFLYATADNLHTVKCSMQDILEWLESDAQC